jgi:hypothetical protein
LPNDESAHGGSKDGVELQVAQFLNEKRAKSFHRRHILADLRALEKMSAVQSGAQDEVSL